MIRRPVARRPVLAAGRWGHADRASGRPAVVAAAARRRSHRCPLGWGRALDRSLFAGERRRGPARIAFFRGITDWAPIGASIGACAALSARGRAPGEPMRSGCPVTCIGHGSKRRSLRERPYQRPIHSARLLIGEPRGTSWPSSHRPSFLAFATVAARGLSAAGGERRA